MAEEERREPPSRTLPGRRLNDGDRSHASRWIRSLPPDLRPSSFPILLGLAHLPAVVTAVRDGGRPVVDVLPPRLVVGVVLGTVVRVLRELARLEVDGRLPEALGHSRLRL